MGLNPSLGELLNGQLLLERHKQFIVPFTQQMMDKVSADALVGQALTEITPKDRDASEVRVYGPIDLSAFVLQAPGIERRMRLPDVMTALTVTYEQGGGDTDYTETNTNSATNPTSVGVSLRGQAQASSFNIPKLVPVTTETWSFNQPVQHVWFYVQGSVTLAAVLARLTTIMGATVLAWPVFKPESITMTLVGTRVNGTCQVSFQASVASYSGSSAVSSFGSGKGLEYSPIIEIQHIPATLHGAFTLSTTSDVTHTATASIASVGGPITGGGASSTSVSASASVSPTTISATSPAALPSSGLRLFDFELEPSEQYGWFFGHAILFDFAVLA